jgi:type I restriction enzyme S subunit
MSSDWKEYRLEEIAIPKRGLIDGPFGSDLPASDYRDSGIPVIRGGNLSLYGRRFQDSGFIYVSEDTSKRLERSLCYPGDIIFTKKGTLGQIGLIPENARFSKYLLSSNQMKLTVNEEIADNKFVYLLLSAKEQIEKIQRESEYTGVPKINLSYLKNFSISLPPLSTQRRIASILTALDDKIELNRRMNETLEGIAQAVWGEWFGKYVGGEEELPEGWRWGTISDLVKHSKESVNPSKSPEKEFNHYSLPAFDNNQTPEKAFGLEILSNKFQVRKYSVLVSKLNPRIPRIWATGNIEEESAICSTEFQVFIPQKSSYYSFINLLFQRKEVQESMTTRASGTSGSHQRVNPSDILNIEVLIPTDAEIERFDRLVRDFTERKFLNNQQSRTLTALRNVLLPRLMRGEVNV